MSFFRVATEGDVAIITLDNDGARVNTLSTPMMRAFADVLSNLEADASVKALVIISGKPDSFIVGADIKEFAEYPSPEEVSARIAEGHALLGRLERSFKPVIAAVHGPCVGGGLELILACHYRIASNHPRTLFALPEVNLGLLPGLGGTQRLPRLVGLQQGLEMILSGKNVYAKPAKKLGLIDALIHPQGLKAAALAAAKGLLAGSVAHRARKTSLKDTLLEKTPLNAIVYKQASELAQKRSRGNYPALPKIIETIRTGMEKGKEAGFAAETKAFAELLFTPESKALRHLFFAKNASEKNPLKDKARAVKTIGVLGAGLMGSGIAQVSAQNGFEVRLKDMTLALAAKGKGAIYKDISRRVGKGLSSFERDVILSRVTPTEHYEDLRGVALTIEAVLETLELKRQVLREIEAVTTEGHVFASNTSSIPISQIAEAAQRPEAVVGMHYFSPVPKMPLIEIIKTDRTADWALATAIEVGLRQGKTVIIAADRPGFYANRILAPYINEALLLLQEGASVEGIDNAMRDFGFPVGPLKLVDEVGLDVGAHVNRVMAPLFAERGIELVQLGDDILDEGLKGRKAGKGFYRYEGGKTKGVNPEIYRYFGGAKREDIAKRAIQERLFMAMVSEAIYALQEGVIETPTAGDVGAVFGIGFPPFLGGPFWYCDAQGLEHIAEHLARLSEQHGPRFSAAEKLHAMLVKGERFYS
jgi:3-hydroxyacyl-CoA dehydrogenase/enoyl-CoA hydratase/3-hydroxybutyryl-CoA epimerase